MDSEQKLIKLTGVDIKTEHARINDYMIRYAVAGSGEPLLLIHGANIGWGTWYANIGAFSRYFTVYALDLPGCGASTKIDFSKTDFERDFIDIVDQFLLKIIGSPASILGHSFGGWIALKLALKRPESVRKIILVDPVGFHDAVGITSKILGFNFMANLLAATVMKPTRKNLGKFLTSVMRKHSNVKEEFIDYYHQGVIRDRITHPFSFINRLMVPGKLRKELLFNEQELSSIMHSVLIIAAEKDPLLPFRKHRRFFNRLPRRSVHVFPDSGHVPQIEESDNFNKTVIQFLRTADTI